MKTSVFMLLICLFGTLELTFAQDVALNNNETKAPVIIWENSNINLGTIKLNEKATVDFSFSNAGNIPLVISSVATSCGCTITSYSKEPINPGESSKISVVYNAGSAGNFSKTITVKSNAKDETMLLKITGIVE